MAKRIRLDAELVRREFAKSRGHAVDLIDAGRVKVDGVVATKAATQVLTSGAVTVAQTNSGPDYASRGGVKLAGALEALGKAAPHLDGRWALDAGASTGGFTDVLLRQGVSHVYAVDVGYGQLAWRLQTDDRVTVMDRTNVRYLAPQDFPRPPDLVVSDLSFISLTLVIPALAAVATDDADFLLMIKPQFEVGKDKLGEGGVVWDPQLHGEAIMKVVMCAEELGLSTHHVVASPLPGPAGNIEYFVHMTSSPSDADTNELIAAALAARPDGSDS